MAYRNSFVTKLVLHGTLTVLLCYIQVTPVLGEKEPSGSCRQTRPLRCYWVRLDSIVHHSCYRDSDCEAGSRCCYRDCQRTCVERDPCENVICRPGYTCQEKSNYVFGTGRWVHQADCVPEEKRLCRKLSCYRGDESNCASGFQNKRDENGCPTCECEPKKDCRQKTPCRMLCPYGQETEQGGCPACRCKSAPENPCSHLTCQPNEECRLIVPQSCVSYPCAPQPRCIPRPATPAMFDNNCGTWDPSTVHLPVLTLSGHPGDGGPVGRSAASVSRWTELDCQMRACPDRTICVSFGSIERRCCWQGTQAQLIPVSKAGECPPDVLQNWMSSHTRYRSSQQPRQTCQLDAQCPGEQKCCSSSNSNDDNDNILGYHSSVETTPYMDIIHYKNNDYVNNNEYDRLSISPRFRSKPGTANRVVERSTRVYGFCMEPTSKILSELISTMT